MECCDGSEVSEVFDCKTHVREVVPEGPRRVPLLDVVVRDKGHGVSVIFPFNQNDVTTVGLSGHQDGASVAVCRSNDGFFFTEQIGAVSGHGEIPVSWNEVK